MENNFLKEVYGYSSIKEELEIIHRWYMDEEVLKDKRHLLPKGILFYGDPGEGKTHIVREYSKTFNYPVFVIEGNEENVQDEIVKIYAKAKGEKKAIVIIDELDKLIDKDIKLTRVLMSQLDGFDKTENILTLATSNNFYDLPEALLREGRFDRKFLVSALDRTDFREIIEGLGKNAGLCLSAPDVDELVDVLFFYTVSTVRAIFNNVSLRYGEKATMYDILNTADFLHTGFLKKAKTM